MNNIIVIAISWIALAMVMIGCDSLECNFNPKTVIIPKVPQAENMCFTKEGRLFVTGSENVYEITKANNGSFHATPLQSQNSYHLGIVARSGYLYVLREKPTSEDANSYVMVLAAAKIVNGTFPQFTDIYPLQNITLGNGMAVLPNGKGIPHSGDLLIADSGIKTGHIVRVSLDPSNPMVVTSQTTWLQDKTVMPNGLVVVNNHLFFTDMGTGSVKSVVLVGNNSDAGTVSRIFTKITILDNISLFPNSSNGTLEYYLIVANYGGRSIIIMDQQGNLVSTVGANFSFPSSMLVGVKPMFNSSQLIVTEKGLIDVTHGPGNDLAVSGFTCSA